MTSTAGNPATVKPSSRAKLDMFDEKILRTLAVDGRISWRQLAERVNLSLTPTLRRVRRLEAEGYINGYGAIVDEARMHGRISVTIMITMEQDNPDAFEIFEQQILGITQLSYCSRFTPSPDYIVHVYASTTDELYGILDYISAIEGVAKVDLLPMLRIARHMKPMACWPKKHK